MYLNAYLLTHDSLTDASQRNLPDYIDPRNDQSFQHIGAWAPEDPHEDVRRREKDKTKVKNRTKEEKVSKERKETKERNGATGTMTQGRVTQDRDTSYQMSRFISQGQEDDPWSFVSQGAGQN